MTRQCYPLCHEKRDFMEVDPPRTEEDFYKTYDPMVGIGTAIALILFFLVITIKACVRYMIRKWQMYNFYKTIDRKEHLCLPSNLKQADPMKDIV